MLSESCMQQEVTSPSIVMDAQPRVVQQARLSSHILERKSFGLHETSDTGRKVIELPAGRDILWAD
jgi:hypothetical protein